MRRGRLRRCGGALLVVAAGTLACLGPAAADTGVSGTVDSVVELKLERTALDRVAATVNATVAPTTLRATGAGEGRAVVKAYDDPVAGSRTTIRATDDAELTITYGPSGP